jgi:hypothetical protein
MTEGGSIESRIEGTDLRGGRVRGRVGAHHVHDVWRRPDAWSILRFPPEPGTLDRNIGCRLASCWPLAVGPDWPGKEL